MKASITTTTTTMLGRVHQQHQLGGLSLQRQPVASAAAAAAATEAGGGGGGGRGGGGGGRGGGGSGRGGGGGGNALTSSTAAFLRQASNESVQPLSAEFDSDILELEEENLNSDNGFDGSSKRGEHPPPRSESALTTGKFYTQIRFSIPHPCI